MGVESFWNRRLFLQTGFTVSAGAVLPWSGLLEMKKNVEKLTVLHTNDTHSQIDPFPDNHPMFANLGGVERRAHAIAEVRANEENVLLLDAGDIFQGTPYFNHYKGVLEMKLMSKMNYDAATIGNHDFDIGLDGFLKAQNHANFPFLCANYDFSNTELEGNTKRYGIFQKGRLKIGVFGVGIELQGLVPKNLYGETVYNDPIEAAQVVADVLRSKGCDLVVCLSHLGYAYQEEKISDLILAKKTEGIHLIIGGHTHTFLAEPTQVLNKKKEIVLINQVGWGGINLGRIDFYFEKSIQAKNQMIRIENE